MISKRTWKRIDRARIPLSILASISIIYDFLTNKIGFVIPTLRFLWKFLNQRIPIFIVIALVLAVLILIKQTGLKLTEKEVFIISLLDEGERGLGLLFKSYKKTFPAEPRTMSNCMTTIQKLEKRKLIKVEALTGGINTIQDELFKLTKKGLKRYRKLDAAIKEKGEVFIFSEVTEHTRECEGELRIEPHEEVVFFLTLLANQINRSMAFRFIDPQYMRQFAGKERADLQILINILERNGLIEKVAMGNLGEIGYTILTRGLTYFQRNRQERGGK